MSDPVRVRDDVLAVNYLIRQPVTTDEAERVIHALALANYEVTKRPPAKAAPKRKRADG